MAPHRRTVFLRLVRLRIGLSGPDASQELSANSRFEPKQGRYMPFGSIQYPAAGRQPANSTVL